MTQWTESDPGEGNTAEMRAGASRFLTDASTVRTAKETIAAASEPARAGWQGMAADALLQHIGTYRPELEEIAAQSESNAGVLQRYANDVDTIQGQQSLITSQLEGATLQRWRVCSGVWVHARAVSMIRTISSCGRRWSR